ncbi:uncharacterized protein [Ptychodera flava]|uniref:uncharacterized protein isoform X2 n=1 Tax=Ptychodera flava TaxID=63121 RepID=UPI00396A3772
MLIGYLEQVSRMNTKSPASSQLDKLCSLPETSSLGSEANHLAGKSRGSDFNNNDDVGKVSQTLSNVETGVPVLDKTIFTSDGVTEGLASQVCRVTSRGDNKLVVKIMDKDLVQREGAIHSKLTGHKNIPTLHGVTYIGGDRYGLVQEYAAGKTLEMMSFDGDLDKITVSQKLNLAYQLCNPVAHFHKHDVIHQNIHPGHIIVDPKTLKVTVLPSSTASLIGEAGRFRGLGESRYLSPESMMDNRAITFREDVWSVGMVLAEIFTGVRPYSNHPELFSSSDYEMFHQKNQELPRFRQRRAANVEWRVFKGKGEMMEQVGVLINLATCSTPDLRPSAHELLRNFKMLHLQCKT